MDIIEWLSSQPNITKSNLLNDIINFEYNNILCKIYLPGKTNKFHIIEIISEKEYIWQDKLNIYCIEKSPSTKEIAQRFLKYLIKEQPKQKIIHEKEKEKEKDNFNIDAIKLKLTFEKLIVTSKSIFDIKTTKKQIFDATFIANIIINEFIEMKKYCLTQKNQINIELLNDNIYSWKIQFTHFDNNSLNKSLESINEKYNYSYIELHLHFHNIYYPNYPPMINIIKPQLCDNLMHRIANSKMVQLDYWSATRNVKYIISRIYNILNKYAIIDDDNKVNQDSITIINIEKYLLQLSPYVNVEQIDEIDKDEVFIKNTCNTYNTSKTTDIFDKSNKTKSKQGWTQGTGYGMPNSQNWDVNAYLKIQEEKDLQIVNIIDNIITELSNINYKEILEPDVNVNNILQKSLLLPYLKLQFKSVNLLDISKHELLFTKYIKLLILLVRQNFIMLFNVISDDNDENLYSELKKLYNSAIIASKIDTNNDFVNKYIQIFTIIEQTYTKYMKTITIVDKVSAVSEVSEVSEISKDKIVKTIDIKEQYQKNMQYYGFITTEILTTNFRGEYKSMFQSQNGSNWSKCLKRISSEIASLAEKHQLPIHYDSSIFLRVDEYNPMILRALITGPVDTPYDNGCFIFDIYLPAEYPQKSPEVWFMNHGGNRLNPNLYDSGKVCLSLLGTYVGPSASVSEKWNADTSTLLQVLISIQAQILIEVPWFNEPGRDSYYNSPEGKKNSDRYNEQIRLYTMKSTILDLLENPDCYPQFSNLIVNHFRLKKDYVLKTCEKWCKEATTLQAQYNTMFEKIKENLNKL